MTGLRCSVFSTMITEHGKVFLRAQWHHILMLNYVVDPELLRLWVPMGTELDQWNGRTYITLVGFLFLGTRLFGIPIPFHSNFEEVNLRFYVRREGPEGWRRGVVFVKEIVPRCAIAAIARHFYHEKYIAVPMRHHVDHPTPTGRGAVRYEWEIDKVRYILGAEFAGVPSPVQEGSEEEFITEHYWGYSCIPNAKTLEYRVEHPRWSVWRVENPFFTGDVTSLYGEVFQKYLRLAPISGFVADGSSVSVFCGRTL